MTNLVSKIKKFKNSIKDTDIQITNQEMQEHLNQLKTLAISFENSELKNVAIDLLNRIEKTNDLKMQIVMLNLWEKLLLGQVK